MANRVTFRDTAIYKASHTMGVTKNGREILLFEGKFTIACWAAFIAILDCTQPRAERLAIPSGCTKIYNLAEYRNGE